MLIKEIKVHSKSILLNMLVYFHYLSLGMKLSLNWIKTMKLFLENNCDIKRASFWTSMITTNAITILLIAIRCQQELLRYQRCWLCNSKWTYLFLIREMTFRCFTNKITRESLQQCLSWPRWSWWCLLWRQRHTCYTFHEITSGVTFADLLVASMAAKLFSSIHASKHWWCSKPGSTVPPLTVWDALPTELCWLAIPN